MSTRQFVKVIVPILVGVALSGCATFTMPGADLLSPSEVAILETGGEGIRIVAIDGKKVGNDFRGYPSRLILTPGEHSVTAEYSYVTVYGSPIIVKFQAEPGRTYETRCNMVPGGVRPIWWNFWIVEKGKKGD